MRKRRWFITLSLISLMAFVSWIAVTGLKRYREQFRDDMISMASDATLLIEEVYKHKQATGQYPGNLYDLTPRARATLTAGGRSIDKDEYVNNHRWMYFRGTNGVSPSISGYAGGHRRLRYEFAPARGYAFPPNVDEGWIVTDEGDYMFLKPFFEPAPKRSPSASARPRP